MEQRNFNKLRRLPKVNWSWLPRNVWLPAAQRQPFAGWFPAGFRLVSKQFFFGGAPALVLLPRMRMFASRRTHGRCLLDVPVRFPWTSTKCTGKALGKDSWAGSLQPARSNGREVRRRVPTFLSGLSILGEPSQPRKGRQGHWGT